MLDKVNPTSQFHPYTPSDATPHSEMPEKSGLRQLLASVGIDSDRIDAISDRLKNVDLRQSAQKARDFAASKPGLVLGGLAVAAIGAGILRGRSNRP